ncbi:DUF2236 domain-containing protein [Tatumella sp. JGM130]|uniref:oxygenase MpaB family protein n=1 Tax=Tatumella sp. JGM130 TaxID=2799797 RepID=UPI001BB016E4|nr:oxygenase MpaB family protein [Tatumella sp. JGM130]MBS0892549.1 DUF2236 domain-containing protein [Tatumella sp. JGM130]
MMNMLRNRIARQVYRLNGLSLNEFDLNQPPGDAGLFGPDSMVWAVHGDFASMLCGGIAALLLQMQHPAALAGVWDHSDFRQDMFGRLRRTSQFIAVTSFGNMQDARFLIEKVKNIHLRVKGRTPDGLVYQASDPALLTWVHVAEMSSFLAAHLRYKNPRLSLADQNRYYAEAALTGTALGAADIPVSVNQVEEYLQAMRPQLRIDQRTLEVSRLLFSAPPPSAAARPVMSIMLRAGGDLLPSWTGVPGRPPRSGLQRTMTRYSMETIARLLRWSIQQGAWHRAMQRVGRLP